MKLIMKTHRCDNVSDHFTTREIMSLSGLVRWDFVYWSTVRVDLNWRQIKHLYQCSYGPTRRSNSIALQQWIQTLNDCDEYIKICNLSPQQVKDIQWSLSLSSYPEIALYYTCLDYKCYPAHQMIKETVLDVCRALSNPIISSTTEWQKKADKLIEMAGNQEAKTFIEIMKIKPLSERSLDELVGIYIIRPKTRHEFAADVFAMVVMYCDGFLCDA